MSVDYNDLISQAQSIRNEVTPKANTAEKVGKMLEDMAQALKDTSLGWWDYNDLATQTTPFAIVGGSGFQNLPNDGDGAQSIDTYKPIGMSDIWDAANSRFDFSSLKLGDTVEIRFALEATTSSLNTELSVQLALGSAAPFVIPIITDTTVKTVQTYPLNRYTKIYMGSADILNNYGLVQMKTSDNIDVEIQGWFVSVVQTHV